MELYWAKQIDWLYFIVNVLLTFPLLIIVLELYWSQKAGIGQPCHLLIVPGGAQVNMANIHVEVVATKIFRGSPFPPHYTIFGWTKGQIFKSCPRVLKLCV